MAGFEDIDQAFRRIRTRVFEIISDSNRNKKEIAITGKNVFYIGERKNTRSPMRPETIEPIFVSLNIHGDKILVTLITKNFDGKKEVLAYLNLEKLKGTRIDIHG